MLIFFYFGVFGLFGKILADSSCDPGPDDRNVALTGTVYASSEISEGAARRVIDGNRDNDYSSGSCFQTSYEKPAWWALELRDVYKISSIIVVNRADCCAERLLGADVRVGESLSKTTSCGTITDVTSSKITLCCQGMSAKYVAIRITSRREFLGLCEVEVYAVSPSDRTVCE